MRRAVTCLTIIAICCTLLLRFVPAAGAETSLVEDLQQTSDECEITNDVWDEQKNALTLSSFSEENSGVLPDMTTEKTSLFAGDMNEVYLWENGGLTSKGVEYSTLRVARTKGYIPSNVKLVCAENDYVFAVAVYDSNDEFVGYWDGKQIGTTFQIMYYLNPQGLQGYKIRLMCQRLGASSISIDECSNIHFLKDTDADAFYPQPTLTFIDDDGSKDALENWESICDEVGINITAALVTNGVGNGTHASWDDIERLQEKGFEFVSHTHNHINIVNSTEEKCIKEFEASIAALREHGCEYRYLVYPYNAITSDRISLVKKYFSAGIGLGGSGSSPGADNSLPLYTYWIRRYSINDTSVSVEKEYNGEIVSAHSFVSLETLKGYIDAAVANGSWVIIMTHLRNDGSFYYDEEIRNRIIELCEYAKGKGVAIQNFSEAFSRFKNVTETGNQSIYGNPHYIVDCNGVVHYRAQCEQGVHVEETVPGRVATCTETGLIEGKRCYVCGETLVAQTEIPALGHKAGEKVKENESGITYESVAYCSVCGIELCRESVVVTSPKATIEGTKVVWDTCNGAYTITNVYVFYIGDQEIADIWSWNQLKSAAAQVEGSPYGGTYLECNTEEKWDNLELPKNGRYIMRVSYTNASGTTETVSVDLTVSVDRKPEGTLDGTKLVMNQNYGSTPISEMHIFYLGETLDESIDVNNWTSLENAVKNQAVPNSPYYRGYQSYLPSRGDDLDAIILPQAGIYVLRMVYTDAQGNSGIRLSQVIEAPYVPGVKLVQNSVLVDDNNGKTPINRVYLFYVADETINNINDFNELAGIGAKYPDINTGRGWREYEGAAIDSIKLPYKGNYVLRMTYTDTADGQTKTITQKLKLTFTATVVNGVVRFDPTEDTDITFVFTFYVGDETGFNPTNWDELVAIGQKYPEINGSKGYMEAWNDELINSIAPPVNGNYVLRIMHTTTVDGEQTQLTASELFYLEKGPIIDIEDGKIAIDTRDGEYTVNMVTAFYVGDKTLTNPNVWSNCVQAATDIEGSPYGATGYKMLLNVYQVKAEKFAVPGNYILRISYNTAKGETYVMTVEVTL